MVDNNLPLIPEKVRACSDVRSVLRTVFHELDYLPPLAVQTTTQDNADSTNGDGDHTSTLPSVQTWVDKYRTESNKICEHEDEMRKQRAKRLACKSLPNVFKLQHQVVKKQVSRWRPQDSGLLSRSHLRPGVEQNAGRDESLWVKNILNVSSCAVSRVSASTEQQDTQTHVNICNDVSVLSYSIGGPVAGRVTSEVPASQSVEKTNYILCVPPKLDFINCIVGNLYTRNIRLINMTKFECRLSITPPKRRELDVEISSARGLTITSGATVELIIRFKPSDVRVLKDQLVVKVSRGQICTLPIVCYMQPPLLDILVANINPCVERATLQSVKVAGDDVEVVEMGARLLGDVHCSRVLFHSDAKHAQFFILTEDAWINWDLDCVTSRSSLIADSFVLWPAWWRGGGLVRACAWCRGEAPGTFEAALRVLSSTAINRRLCLLADVLLFNPRHLIIEAHEKDFDICSEDDPGCQYYVNVGTALQHRSLYANIELANNSPISYNYYWDVRRWGVCFCWDDDKELQALAEENSDILCIGAKQSKRLAKEDPEAYIGKSKIQHVVVVEPGDDEILPRTTCTLRVSVPDVGEDLGTQRSVLRLILKNIPRDSFPEDYNPKIISTKYVESMQVPGLQSIRREVCDVVVAEMEVWWKVVPLRFILDPLIVPLHHSRRVSSVKVDVMACKLFGWDTTRVWFEGPACEPHRAPLSLSAARCLTTSFTVPLPILPNNYPATDIITMKADNGEWKSECVITRQCESRHPALTPDIIWLGVVPPKTTLHATFTIHNDTYQHICFWCDVFRWVGENEPRPACVGRIPCTRCREVSCTCAILSPSRGALHHGDSTDIFYNVNAPERDGCVATVVRVRRCEPGLALVHDAGGTEARAALVAYRVLAPTLTLRVKPCDGTRPECGDCDVDAGALCSSGGTAVLRPSKSLVVGRRTCYRLLVTNLTPLPTSVHFDKPIDGADVLQVTFTPNDFSLAGYGKMKVTVVLSARAVCSRRLWVRRAVVLRAHKPLYLVIDTAIDGVQVSLQVPIGGGVTTDNFVVMRRSQISESEDKSCPRTPHQLFAEEDCKRDIVKENVCRCHYKMMWIPAVKRPRPPPQTEDDHSPIEIVSKPPSLTRVCRCHPHCKPYIPDAPHSIALEFIDVPLRTVCERRMLLRNESVVTAHWNTTVRRWPRRHLRTIDKDKWAGDVCSSGVVIECSPGSGVLASRGSVELLVQMYADCWGLYCDQILIQVDNVEPIVVDVWIRVVGPPLQFKMQPNYNHDEPPILWMSPTDARRSLLVKNISRSDLTVHAYLTRENERRQDALPFRLYLRMYDVLPPTCPCVTAFNSGSELSSISSHTCSDIETGLEVYLAPDHGPQDDHYYTVQPQECLIKAEECMKWDIVLDAPPSFETSPATTLMLRIKPHKQLGDKWYRDEPLPQLVQLRQVSRLPRIKLSCDEIVVKICALDLPQGDFIRIRKRFQVLNVGNGRFPVRLETAVPWCMVQTYDSDNTKKKKTSCRKFILQRTEELLLDLPPTSSTKVCVEVCIATVEAWPVHDGSTVSLLAYAPYRRETTPLHIYDDLQLLMVLPCVVEVEYPVIKIKPSAFDFGLVTDGDSSKTYISVSHTSPTATLCLVVHREGCGEFEFRPSTLQVAPGQSERIYVQYTAVWRHGPAECSIVVRERSAAGGGARCGGWCRATALFRASPALDHKWHTPVRDHTDDGHLLPPRVIHLLPASKTTR